MAVIDLLITYDFEGWAYQRRAEALARLAPDDFRVRVARLQTAGLPPDQQRAHRAAVLGERAPDLAFVLNAPQAAGLSGAIREGGHPTRLVVAFNNGWPRYRDELHRWFEFADLVIFNNRDYWERAGRPLPSVAIANGVDLATFRVTEPVEGRRPRVIWCGSEYNRAVKGYDELIVPLFARLREEGVECEELLVDSKSGTKRTAAEMAEWYNRATVLVVASDSEGTPNPALEAAACGCTIVSTRVGNMPELIRDGENGFLVDRDLESLHRGVQRAIAGHARLAAELGRDIAAWDWPRRAPEFFEVFRAVVAGGPRPPEATREYGRHLALERRRLADPGAHGWIDSLGPALVQRFRDDPSDSNLMSVLGLLAGRLAGSVEPTAGAPTPGLGEAMAFAEATASRSMRDVTVVVPVRNDARGVARCLDAILAQDCPASDFEIIAVDNGSTDDTLRVLAGYAPRVRVLSEPRPGVSWARNAATLAASGTWIAFTDSDCVPRPDWLRNLVEAGRRDPGVSFVGGPIVAFASANSIARFAEALFDQRRSILDEKPPAFISANLLAHRESLIRCGMFNPEYPRGQDTELAWRSQSRFGARIAFCGSAVVEHDNPSTLGALVHKGIQHGRGSARLIIDFQPYHRRSISRRRRQTKPYTDALRATWNLLPLPRRLGGTGESGPQRRDAFYFALFRLVRHGSFIYHSLRIESGR